MIFTWIFKKINEITFFFFLLHFRIQEERREQFELDQRVKMKTSKFAIQQFIVLYLHEFVIFSLSHHCLIFLIINTLFASNELFRNDYTLINCSILLEGRLTPRGTSPLRITWEEEEEEDDEDEKE